jgi:hypothetical protein
MSSLTPVRDDRSAPRDLSVSGSRARPHGLPWNGGVTRPRSLFSVALLRRGSSLGRAKANQRKDCGAKYPGDSASRYCGEAARPWHFALTPPPPWAAHGNGQPRACLPSEFSGYFPEPPNFSAAPSITSPLTNKPYMRQKRAHSETRPFPRYPLDRSRAPAGRAGRRTTLAVEALSLPSRFTRIASGCAAFPRVSWGLFFLDLSCVSWATA